MSEYNETACENKVSHQSVLCGSQNIVLNGKTIVMNDYYPRVSGKRKNWTSLCCEKSECPKATIQEIQQRRCIFSFTYWGPHLY